MAEALVAFRHHVQIIDIARLGKIGGIQKVAAKLFGNIRIVFGKMLRGLDGVLVKVAWIETLSAKRH